VDQRKAEGGKGKGTHMAIPVKTVPKKNNKRGKEMREARDGGGYIPGFRGPRGHRGLVRILQMEGPDMREPRSRHHSRQGNSKTAHCKKGLKELITST